MCLLLTWSSGSELQMIYGYENTCHFLCAKCLHKALSAEIQTVEYLTLIQAFCQKKLECLAKLQMQKDHVDPLLSGQENICCFRTEEKEFGTRKKPRGQGITCSSSPVTCNELLKKGTRSQMLVKHQFSHLKYKIHCSSCVGG